MSFHADYAVDEKTGELTLERDLNGCLKQPVYLDGRTKQSFKDECDINKLLVRAQKSGTLSHLQKYEKRYGDFADYDFMENTLKMTEGRQIFDALPSELRREFNQSPAAFFEFVNDPENKDLIAKKLPALAEPGRQNIDVSGKTSPDPEQAPEVVENKQKSDPPRGEQGAEGAEGSGATENPSGKSGENAA